MNRKKVLSMEANEFISLCKRLPAYVGAVRSAVAGAHADATARKSPEGVSQPAQGTAADTDESTPPDELARLRWEMRIKNAPEKARQDGKFEEVDMNTASDADVMAFIAS